MTGIEIVLLIVVGAGVIGLGYVALDSQIKKYESREAKRKNQREEEAPGSQQNLEPLQDEEEKTGSAAPPPSPPRQQAPAPALKEDDEAEEEIIFSDVEEKPGSAPPPAPLEQEQYFDSPSLAPEKKKEDADEVVFMDAMEREPAPAKPAPQPNDQSTLSGGITADAAYFLSAQPKSMPLDEWQPLYAYVFRQHKASEVYQDAMAQLGKQAGDYSTTAQAASTTISEGAEITATPQMDGFQFKPLRVTLGFYDDWERFSFELRAKSAPVDQFATGRITFTVEGVIIGEIPLSIYVGKDSAEWEFEDNATKMYQSVFCSYSHADTKIIERVERAYKSLGMEYLRDITTLKSGTHWSDELLRLIDRADVFQLFWSQTAAESPYVRQEWEYALQYDEERPNFIRPVWWEDDMPPVPQELRHIHFWHQPDLDEE